MYILKNASACWLLSCFSHVQLFAIPWAVACQAPLSMGFSSVLQEHWSGLPFPSPGDLLNPGIEPRSPPLQADSLRLSHQGSWENASSCIKISVSQKVQTSDSPGGLVKIAQWSPPLELLIHWVRGGGQETGFLTSLPKTLILLARDHIL